MKEIALGPNLFTKIIQALKKKYQRITGLLMFSIIKLQPNIAFTIAIAVHYIKNPSHVHIETIKTILYYMKELINYSIIYAGKKKLIIKDYSDSNQTSDKKSCKSIFSFIFILNGGLVS